MRYWQARQVIALNGESELLNHPDTISLERSTNGDTPENRMEKIDRALDVLYSIVSVASVCQNRDIVLERILKQVLALVKANVGGIYLLDEKTGLYVLEKYVGISEDFSRKHGVITREFKSFLPVIDDRQVICVNNVLDLPDSPLKDNVIREGMSSYAGIPLESRKKVLGILTLSSSSPHHYSPEELFIFRLIGKHVGIALNNFTLFDELKESEERYRDLFENAIDIIYTIDAKGNFTNINGAGVKILGYPREEIIGSHISKYVAANSFIAGQEAISRLLTGELPNHTLTLEVKCRSGELKMLEITERVIQNSSSSVEIHGIARDITEKMKLKHELASSNKQRKLLCYLIQGTRGGKTRASILKHLAGRSYNAYQLAKVLDIDYKTVRHHLDVLIKNGIITRNEERYSAVYFVSKNIESRLSEISH